DSGALSQVAHELADYFFAAERHGAWEPIGYVLSADDVKPDPKSVEYTGVLTGQQPQFQHLVRGFVRDRSHIFDRLFFSFTDWLSSVRELAASESDKVPVFWISGRSGEGKSVLLLQLAAAALRSKTAGTLVHLKAGDDLPRLLSTVPDRKEFADSYPETII